MSHTLMFCLQILNSTLLKKQEPLHRNPALPPSSPLLSLQGPRLVAGKGSFLMFLSVLGRRVLSSAPHLLLAPRDPF